MRQYWRIFLGIIMPILAGCSAQENAEIAEVGRVDFNILVQEVEGFAPKGQYALMLSSADGQYSQYWDNYDDFPSYEVFHVGEYKAEIISGSLDGQGYDCPCYAGSAVFNITSASTTHVQIECKLQQAIIAPKFTEGFIANFQDTKIIAHPFGTEYVNIKLDSKPILLTPGETSVIIGIKNGAEEAMISPGLEIKTEAGKTYSLTVNSPKTDFIELEVGDSKAQLEITPQLLQAKEPEITAIGFQPGEKLSLIEGYPAPKSVEMQVSSASALKQLTLTAIGIDKFLPDFPSQCNLMAEGAKLKEYGLVTEVAENSALVDFTGLLENIRVENSSELKFMLQACDALGRLSQICQMEVEIKNVDFAIVTVQPAVIGIDLAQVALALNTEMVESSDFEIYRILDDAESTEKLEITAASIDKEKKLITLEVKVPEGINAIPIAVNYMGTERARGEITRSVPAFEIIVDPFSTSAAILIKAQPQAVQEAITKYANIWNKDKKLSVNKRLIKEGIIGVLGLKPNENFDLEVSVIEDQFSASAKIHTEKASQIPEGDFEDFVQLITYDQMPAGGAYSSSPFPIYNMHNYADFDVKWPSKYWTSANSKTFCNKASNINTWYLQPSAWLDLNDYASGAKSVCLSSVGWSLKGADIPPYMQDGEEYLPYNPNVPSGVHHAAGKLFLGSYIFDPSTEVEVYDEGIKFDCRPTSINGYYKYVPDENDANDKGYMKIELINDDSGEDVIISSAEKEFTGAPDFIAFNLPLEYKAIGIKTTKLKIFFASSSRCGDIEYEDQNVPVSPWVNDSKFVGSMLWIDNLSFSY